MYLLDTNVVSELHRSRADPNVKAWFASTRSKDLFVSVLVVGEIRMGVEQLRRRRDLVQAASIEAWLREMNERFAERVLPVTIEIAEEWGRLNAPDRLPPIDGLMAATAKVHDLTLVTRNTQDVARAGIRLLDPWTAN